MPRLELVNETKVWRLENTLGREEAFSGGNVAILPPLTAPPLTRLRFRRLRCLCRVQRSVGLSDFGFADAIIDTGCPVSIIPKHIWKGAFHFEEGRHFEVCHIADLGERIRNQLLASSLTCRVARLKVPVVLAGTSFAPEHLLRIDNLVAQLSDTNEPQEMLLGLWGGVFEGRRLVVDRLSETNDLAARFEW